MKSAELAQRYPSNVMMMGQLSKSALYQQISSSQLWTYPTNFPEIFGIGLAEAQACGTPVISTEDFAVKETVKNGVGGVLIPGNPVEKEYVDEFVKTVLRLLDNKEE